MKLDTVPGPDFISADVLKAGDHPINVILAAHMTSYLQKERVPELLGPHPEVSRVIEICFLLVVIFIYYVEAFDCIETNAIPSALVYQGVDTSYVRTLANCYDRCTTKIQLFHYPLPKPFGKRIRQIDTISPKLFMAVLQWIMRTLFLGSKGHTS
ncbi:hypothetical protein RB195_007242 [Necator americanus]|uniref:Uncharacterized protein n=1 Tax=Necator americanus TaxID=51031 RepID=A0ABR1BWB0_NECAM